MAELSTKAERRTSGPEPATWADRFATSASEWEEELGLTSGWTIAGIALIALGALAVYHFGPDFRRYLKIKRM